MDPNNSVFGFVEVKVGAKQGIGKCNDYFPLQTFFGAKDGMTGAFGGILVEYFTGSAYGFGNLD